jgi:hypothetical protein
MSVEIGDNNVIREYCTEASEILSPLNPRALHPRAVHPRDTMCASRMLMDHGKPEADFQQVDCGTGDIAGTPDIARDRRLTPVYRANPDRRRGLGLVSVLGRFDRQ